MQTDPTPHLIGSRVLYLGDNRFPDGIDAVIGGRINDQALIVYADPDRPGIDCQTTATDEQLRAAGASA